MIIGIPKERPALKGIEEKRVSLSPAGVREVTAWGAEVVVTSGAGVGAGFTDEEYRAAGARIVYSNEEAIRRADLVLKVQRPTPEEWTFFQERSALMAFLHLAVAPKEFLRALVERRLTAIGFEIVQEPDGALPILRSSSEIAGKMAVQIAGRLLESTSGGRGILLGGIPGIPPADVVILGGGTLGYYAARSFLGIGASVYILDKDMKRLMELDRLFEGRVVTALATASNIEKFVAFADVLIGAVLVPGQRAPILVTKEMVQRMRPGSLIMDFSIDQGGCVETSTLTPSEEFLFTSYGVTHFCAPNVPAMVARTSTHALTNAVLPYLREIVHHGLLGALKRDAALRRGLYAFNGSLTQALPSPDLPCADLERLVQEAP
ncbi:Alanine dehydrogenase [bacterium HR10]|nr:Alanine dehydrogenase [bacterium HR10]